MGNDKPKITVRLENQEMEAYINFQYPGDIKYTKEDVMTALADAKVKVGFEESRIDEILKQQMYGVDILIAKGKETVNGTDGYYEFCFNENPDNKPVIREDGSVDYHNVKAFEIVEKGQVIATYHEPVDGACGMTVTGKLQIAKRGRPMPPLGGTGFTKSEDGSTYTADLTGKIEKSGNKIRILQVYELFSDVDLTTGDIDFHGDILIHGNVRVGAKLHATGSITIEGVAESCYLSADKEIVLQGGFLGGEKGTIFCGGDIHAKFLEYGRIECFGNLDASSALNCHILCHGRILMQGRQAAIVGGYVYGACGVEATYLGNRNEVHTKIRAGLIQDIMVEMAELRNTISDSTARIAQITAGIQAFDKKNEELGLDMKNDERRVALLRARIEFQAQLSQAKAKLSRYESTERASQGCRVRVLGCVFSNTSVAINEVKVRLSENQEMVDFCLENDKLHMYSLRGAVL